jgi:hypothetical protein
MELQEFVSETLKEIIAGVKEAQVYARDNGAVANPGTSRHVPPGMYERGSSQDLSPIEKVEFDVAVTSTDASETQAGAGIFVAAFGIGVKDKSDTSNSSISRIRFSVPIVLPEQSTT